MGGFDGYDVCDPTGPRESSVSDLVSALGVIDGKYDANPFSIILTFSAYDQPSL